MNVSNVLLSHDHAKSKAGIHKKFKLAKLKLARRVEVDVAAHDGRGAPILNYSMERKEGSIVGVEKWHTGYNCNERADLAELTVDYRFEDSSHVNWIQASFLGEEI